METAERSRGAGLVIGGMSIQVDDQKAQSKCLYLLNYLRSIRCLDCDSGITAEQIHF